MARCLKQTKVGKYVLYFADVSMNTGINIPGESPFIKDEEKGYAFLFPLSSQAKVC